MTQYGDQSMKKLCTMLMFLIMCTTNIYAQDIWVPFQEYRQTTVVQNYPITTIPQPVVVYQWVPVLVNQNTFVEHQCLFRKTQTVTTQPVLQWVYQPVIVYR